MAAPEASVELLVLFADGGANGSVPNPLSVVVLGVNVNALLVAPLLVKAGAAALSNPPKGSLSPNGSLSPDTQNKKYRMYHAFSE